MSTSLVGTEFYIVNRLDLKNNSNSDKLIIRTCFTLDEQTFSRLIKATPQFCLIYRIVFIQQDFLISSINKFCWIVLYGIGGGNQLFLSIINILF